MVAINTRNGRLRSGGHCTDPNDPEAALTRGRNQHYRKTSNISRTLVGNKIVDNSDVVGASPVTSSFST